MSQDQPETQPHTQINGDKIGRDKIGGDKIGRDKIGGDKSSGEIGDNARNVQVGKDNTLFDIKDSDVSVNVTPKPERVPTRVPKSRTPSGLIGRETEMDWLRERLTRARDATNAADRQTALAGVRGIGGIGKTELAIAIATELAPLFAGGAIWLPCSERSVLGIQDLLAAHMGQQLSGDDAQQRANQLAQWLADHPPCLVVLDDVRAPHLGQIEQIAPLAEVAGSALLLTSRRRNVLPADAVYDVETLSPAASLDLLTQVAGMDADGSARAEAEAECAVEIVDLLGQMPLAITIVGRYVQKICKRKRAPGLPLAATLNALKERRTHLLNMDPTQTDLSIAATLDLSYAELDPTDQACMAALGVFARNEFDLAAAQTVWDCDEATARTTLQALENAGLIDELDEDAWWLHDLLAEDGRARLYEEANAAATRNHAAWVEALLSEIELRSLESWQGLFALRPEIERAGEWLLQRWADDPNLAANLAVEFGEKLYATPSDNLISQLRVGLDAARQNANNEPPHDAATILNKLAYLLQNRGQYDEAEYLYRECLTIFKGLGDRRSTAVTQSLLANLLQNRGQYDEAEHLYRESLRISEELGRRRDIAVTQSSLAVLLRNRGQYDDAKHLYRESLMVFEELGDSRGIATTRLSLAHFMRATGHDDEAEDLWKSAMDIAIVIGDLQIVHGCEMWLGQLVIRQGQQQEGIALLERAKAGFGAIGLHNWAENAEKSLAQARVDEESG